mgnify:CR=1 FL=1|jgi:predicted lipoprotein with Yx(FWY)xxD motif
MTLRSLPLKTFLLAAALALPGLVHAADPAMTKDGILVDHKGMTLYTFAKDAGGKSMCNDKCAANWPPLAADAMAKNMGEWTAIKRDDGTMQWAYDGKPLYTFVMDKKAGDMTGDNKMDGAWKVAKP